MKWSQFSHSLRFLLTCNWMWMLAVFIHTVLTVGSTTFKFINYFVLNFRLSKCICENKNKLLSMFGMWKFYQNKLLDNQRLRWKFMIMLESSMWPRRCVSRTSIRGVEIQNRSKKFSMSKKNAGLFWFLDVSICECITTFHIGHLLYALASIGFQWLFGWNAGIDLLEWKCVLICIP